METKSEEKNLYTFGMIKPDGMEHIEEIIKMIQSKGFRFVYWKYMTFTGELIDAHYPHVKKKFPEDYKKLYDSMKDQLVFVFILYDKNGNAIKNYRDVLGVTKSWEARPDTIRGMFGDKEIIYKNVAHGSGNLQEAQEETIRFLHDDLFDVYENIVLLREYEKDLINTGVSETRTKKYTDEQVLNMIMEEHGAYVKKKGE